MIEGTMIATDQAAEGKLSVKICVRPSLDQLIRGNGGRTDTTPPPGATSINQVRAHQSSCSKALES